MNENLSKFFVKAMEDKELQEQIVACKSPEEAYAIASSVQEGFTMEEFTKAMQKLYDATHEKELTDEDLAKAAGGNGDDEFSIFTAMSGVFATAFSVYTAIEAASSAASAAAGCAV